MGYTPIIYGISDYTYLLYMGLWVLYSSIWIIDLVLSGMHIQEIQEIGKAEAHFGMIPAI